VRNFCEPFFGSGAVLLGRPTPFSGPETVNDLNGWLTNFWRAVRADPNAVAKWADYPVSELDLHARGDWLFYGLQGDGFVEKMRSDPEYYDAKMAGWWVWGLCAWIGSGWRRVGFGAGVHRQLPHLGNAGLGIHRQQVNICEWLTALSDRLRRTRICCGDWQRVLGPSVTVKIGLTGVFLDPPYEFGERAQVYAVETNCSVAVREWAIENGDHPLFRIALCGYDTEHSSMKDHGWIALPWKTPGGFGNQGNKRGRANKVREVVWFSPHCLRPGLFDQEQHATRVIPSLLGKVNL
jgi:hypothetical protein